MHRCTHTYNLLLLLLQLQWKSAQKDANTARPPQSPHRRTESAMAGVRQSQNFPPATDPLPGRAGPPKFNHRPSLVKIDARNFELSSWHRPPTRPPETHRQDRLQYTAPLASAQCNYYYYYYNYYYFYYYYYHHHHYYYFQFLFNCSIFQRLLQVWLGPWRSPKSNLWFWWNTILQAACPSCHPTKGIKELKGKST